MRSIIVCGAALLSCIPSPGPEEARGTTTSGAGGSSTDSSTSTQGIGDGSDGAESDTAIDDTTTGAPTLDCGLPGLAGLATTPGPHATTLFELEFVDDSRPTPPHEDFEGSSERVLPTAVWLPEEATEPLPLVIHSHGFSATHLDEAYLAQAWASWGFIVAAPGFPGTGVTSSGGPNTADVTAQPGDLAFVIGQLVDAAADPRSPLFERIDPDAVALTGLSLGATTAVMALDDPPPGVRSAVLLATPACFWESPPLGSGAVATLAIHGDADIITPFVENANPLVDAVLPGSFVVRLERGTHTAFSGVTGPGLRGADNADELGCGFLVPDYPAMWTEIADAIGGDAGLCSPLCSTPMPWTTSISAEAQRNAAIALSLIHLQRTLRDCQDAHELWSIIADGGAAGVEVL